MSNNDSDNPDFMTLQELSNVLVLSYLEDAELHNWRTDCLRPSLQFYKAAR